MIWGTDFIIILVTLQIFWVQAQVQGQVRRRVRGRRGSGREEPGEHPRAAEEPGAAQVLPFLLLLLAGQVQVTTRGVRAARTGGSRPGFRNRGIRGLCADRVGCLMFLSTSTRADISYAVKELSRHLVHPTDVHMSAADRCLGNSRPRAHSARSSIADIATCCSVCPI